VRRLPVSKLLAKPHTDDLTAKPSTAILPLRSIQAASISTTSAKDAAAESGHVQVSGAPAGLPMSVTGKVKREVPLPSQQEKKGGMQYALYVRSSCDGFVNSWEAN
jgi:hypothetical protein